MLVAATLMVMMLSTLAVTTSALIATTVFVVRRYLRSGRLSRE